jgi:hypothetical protein
MYDITRVSWKNEKFAKQYPKETAYRHSLGEEADALHLVATVAETNFKGKKIDKLDPALQKLVVLDQEGLLESYILIVKADQGIAQDYAAYRDAHRDLLRKYFLEYVVPKD